MPAVIRPRPTPKRSPPRHSTRRSTADRRPPPFAAGSKRTYPIPCFQTNAGVRIAYTDAFLANHTSYSATVRQVQGSLLFAGSDALRTGYFLADEATLSITADDAVYEQVLNLEPRKIYNVIVDDEALKPASGKLSVSITVSTDVVQEDIRVVFPSGSESYSEDMGTDPVGANTLLAAFRGWSDTKAAYAGAGASISSQNPSDTYDGASGGNNLLFTAAGSYFTVSGLNTSLSRSAPTLSFGACNTTKNYNVEELTVGVSTDGGATFTPLTLGPDAHQPNRKWERITVTGGVPQSANLTLRFECKASDYRIDDIRLETAP